jgi:DNA-binding MarR family transcriptional regulator
LSAHVTPELTVFARLLRAHAALRRALEARLLTEHGLTVNDYETLLHLSREPEGMLRRVDLAERLTLTPSGVTRLLDGLESHGLVDKRPCSTDARVTYAVLTEEGRLRLEEAAATQIDGISSLVGTRLDEDELAALAELLGRLPGVGPESAEACLPGSADAS